MSKVAISLEYRVDTQTRDHSSPATSSIVDISHAGQRICHIVLAEQFNSSYPSGLCRVPLFYCVVCSKVIYQLPAIISPAVDSTVESAVLLESAISATEQPTERHLPMHSGRRILSAYSSLSSFLQFTNCCC